MMGTGVLPGRKKIYRFQIARVAGVQNGHAVAEHVTDIEVIAVQHDLDAVRSPANVAVGNMLDPMTQAFRWDALRWDAFRWNRRILGEGRTGHAGQRHYAQHTPQMRAAARPLHGFPRV